MNTLDDLFDDAEGRPQSASSVDARDVERLRSLVGAASPAAGSRGGGSASEQRLLSDIVGEASASSAAPGAAETGRADAGSPAGVTKVKTQRRTAGDWVSVGVAVTAVGAVLAVGALAIVQRTTADDVSQATRSLREQEAELRNRITTLETSLSLYGSAVTDATAVAESAEPALAALEGKSDEAARATAVQAVAGFREALAALDVPADATTYARGTATPTDLAAAAARLDEVRARALEVDGAIDDTREARSAVAATQSGLLAALAAFGATVPASGGMIAEENPYASDAYRAAVLATADDIVAAQRRGESGAAQMTAYGQAVDALRIENQRVMDARTPVRQNAGGWAPPRTTTPVPTEESTPEVPPADTGTEPGTDPLTPDPGPTSSSPTP
ncbi:MAG: hypothetical protein ACTHNQ_02675 [Microbacterium sp.]|uniref:hypothetical protein n=1 Tax=Microbacterium sp. TaxID=51671 RepID=UPI003F7F5899